MISISALALIAVAALAEAKNGRHDGAIASGDSAKTKEDSGQGDQLRGGKFSGLLNKVFSNGHASGPVEKAGAGAAKHSKVSKVFHKKVAPRAGTSCTADGGDMWSTGSKVPCCAGLEKYLTDDHRWSCRPGACTGEGGDMWSTGSEVPCCAGLEKYLTDDHRWSCRYGSTPTPGPGTLVFSDEFDYDGPPDPNKWTYDLGDGCSIGKCDWGNHEKAIYTNDPSNVWVANGMLSIRAKRVPNPVYKDGVEYLTSARVVSRGKAAFQYGSIQFRASLSKCTGRGTWPALWMLPEPPTGPWPVSGEIDIMEAVGHDPNMVYGHVHTANSGNGKGAGKWADQKEFHVYETKWTHEHVQFLVDGQLYYSYERSSVSANDWPFDAPFHLLMNLAVGGDWGGKSGAWPGIDYAAFDGDGQIIEVDWVRWYQYGEQVATM